MSSKGNYEGSPEFRKQTADKLAQVAKKTDNEGLKRSIEEKTRALNSDKPIRK